LAVRVEAHPDAEPKTETLRTFLFHAARELLFNVAKHAGVKRAKVSVAVSNGCIELVVSDTGKGFDVEELVKTDAHSGFGLFNIRERLSLLEGRLEARSQAGKGSTFKLIVPIQPGS